MRETFDDQQVVVLPMNEHYESDVRHAMQFCRWVLKPIGIWSLMRSGASRTEKFVSIFFLMICYASMCFIVLPCGIHIFAREKDIDVKVKLIGPTCFCVSSMIKYFFFARHSSALGRCFDHVETDWRLVQDRNHRSIMTRCATLGRKLTILCASFMYAGGVSFHTIMPLSLGRMIVDNATIRPLIYHGYDLLFDYQSSPAYEIVFCVHCFTALIMYNITTAAGSMAAIFVTHVCGQIEIITSRLDDAIGRATNKKSDLKAGLAAIVKDHVRVLRFSKNVEKVLREICLFELVVSSLTICLLEYHCTTEWQNSNAIVISTYFVLLVSLSFNVFIFCYIGDLLVAQCNQVGLATYNSCWYCLSKKKALDLILIMTISHYPPKITAGKLIELSLTTFSRVLNSSLVYLNVLRTVTE